LRYPLGEPAFVLCAGEVAPVEAPVDVLEAGSAAGARMAETLAFFEFLRREMTAVLERWREERDAQRPGSAQLEGR
jgi:hypothetical protein